MTIYINTEDIIISLICEIKKKKTVFRDFPGDPVVKNPPANTGDMGLISDQGRFHLLQSS